MIKKIILLFMLQFVLSYSLHANEQLNIFACEPEWKALAEEIGGNNIGIHPTSKPAPLQKIRSARLILAIKLGLARIW